MTDIDDGNMLYANVWVPMPDVALGVAACVLGARGGGGIIELIIRPWCCEDACKTIRKRVLTSEWGDAHFQMWMSVLNKSFAYC